MNSFLFITPISAPKFGLVWCWQKDSLCSPPYMLSSCYGVKHSISLDLLEIYLEQITRFIYSLNSFGSMLGKI